MCVLFVCLQTERDRGGVQQAEPSQRRGRGELVTLQTPRPFHLSPPPLPFPSPQHDLINTHQPRQGHSCMYVRMTRREEKVRKMIEDRLVNRAQWVSLNFVFIVEMGCTVGPQESS